MTADYSADIKIVIFHSVLERRSDECRTSSNCGRIVAKIERFNSENSKIVGRKFTKFGNELAWLLPLKRIKFYDWPICCRMPKERVKVVPCDADCKLLMSKNSGVTEPNLTKSLQGVHKWLPISVLKSKLWSSNPFADDNVTNEDRRQIAGESQQKLLVFTA